MQEKLNIPDDALCKLQAYTNSVAEIANILKVKKSSITDSAYYGFHTLDEKQKVQVQEISDTLSLVNSYNGVSTKTAEKILVKTLENLTKTENKQGYLNLVQFITHPYTFNIKTANGDHGSDKEQFEIAKHLIENSFAFEYDTLKIHEAYKNRKNNTENLAINHRLQELRKEYGNEAENMLKKEIAEKAACMESIVKEFLALPKLMK